MSLTIDSFMNFTISIDTGGTFTDCIAVDSAGQEYRCKVLSKSALRSTVEYWIDLKAFVISDDWGLKKDVLAGFEIVFWHEKQHVCHIQSFDTQTRTIQLTEPIESELWGQTFSVEITAHEEAPVLAARLVTQTPLHEAFPPMQMKLGSTKGTNALLEMKGAKTAFFVTKGFKDLLIIGNQARPDIFALHVQKPQPLYIEVVEVSESIDAQGIILQKLDIAPVLSAIQLLKSNGVESIAICLKNAYKNNYHEQQLADLLRNHFGFVSVSTELSPQIKFLNRAETTVVNAYLSPVIHRYLQNINAKLPNDSLRVMTSAGNLVRLETFQPKDSLLSGPAGGVVGAAKIAKAANIEQLITFDMGGTSTDVARYDGDFDFKYDVKIGAAHIFTPTLSIETVAAGGGSICDFDGFKLTVGPESAGSQPGPACYGVGGPLTITDVNLLLGRLDYHQFSIPVFPEKAQQRLEILLDQIEQKTGKRPAAEAILEGFVQIANETMAEAVRKISIAKGYDPSQYALVAFGGAGGLHACGIANLLNINTILLPKDAGLLSAYGILHAPIERFAEKPVLQILDAEQFEQLHILLKILENEAIAKVTQEGVDTTNIKIRRQLLSLRLKGQDASLEVDFADLTQVIEDFKKKYIAIYGYWNEQRAIEIESLRVIATEIKPKKIESEQQGIPKQKRQRNNPTQTHTIKAWVNDQWASVPVYGRENLPEGTVIHGFAVLLDKFSTTVIEQGWQLEMKADGLAMISRQSVINREQEEQKQTFHTHQSIELELFTNRFKSIAENMGVMLQRTSLSVNVKERLDFSCALLDTQGELIANAPHIPVHLGSLGVCVRSLMRHIAMRPGDTVITNHPGFGGSHLPDVTLVTPVYHYPNKKNTAEASLIGFVVNRCHHAEIGGIRPGSMPPNAKNLAEEGVVIPPMYLVNQGVVQWDMIQGILTQAPYPTRAVEENLADLNAALAGNRNGEQALQGLVNEYGLVKVHFYMNELKRYSAEKMRQRLSEFPAGIYKAEEKLDDGTRLSVKITLESQAATIDFSGSAGVHTGNLNGNEAIVQSVVVYVLRTLLHENIPLNDGILKPIEIIIPENSILKPHFPEDSFLCPAVVGGNVELSQRLTDTLLKALGVLACSQGTMNNTLFGNDRFGYYETICGGTGAGNGFDGASAVHHHMTNTRITDPEVMEWRYPVRLERFEVRANSGGRGQWAGGDGVIREITFLESIQLSVLSQHRNVAPYGLSGGASGQTGGQYIIRQNGNIEALAGIDGATLYAGDQFVIETPGGGGFGSV